MLIMSEKKASRLDVQIPDMVLVQIIANDESGEIKNQKMVSGLYEAFDLGTAWSSATTARKSSKEVPSP